MALLKIFCFLFLDSKIFDLLFDKAEDQKLFWILWILQVLTGLEGPAIILEWFSLLLYVDLWYCLFLNSTNYNRHGWLQNPLFFLLIWMARLNWKFIGKLKIFTSYKWGWCIDMHHPFGFLFSMFLRCFPWLRARWLPQIFVWRLVFGSYLWVSIFPKKWKWPIDGPSQFIQKISNFRISASRAEGLWGIRIRNYQSCLFM